ncbi:MAG: hypothetical protein H6741_32705 [Alphaproteobacteria bacterium]|nr:hypothetical protein [Alphaproteobacteria bacterium]MCB9797477.1 hypothetical protein [Alphaproteobacteria bacterium]
MPLRATLSLLALLAGPTALADATLAAGSPEAAAFIEDAGMPCSDGTLALMGAPGAADCAQVAPGSWAFFDAEGQQIGAGGLVHGRRVERQMRRVQRQQARRAKR